MAFKKVLEGLVKKGEKEISPKMLKITPRVLMITFGVIEMGVTKFCEYPSSICNYDYGNATKFPDPDARQNYIYNKVKAAFYIP